MNKFKLSLLGCLIGASSPMLHAAIADQNMVNPQSGVVVGYWHNWCGGAGYQGGTAPCVKLDQIDPRYNVVDVSFMKVHGSDTIPTFKLDPATGMNEGQFIEQIAELNRQGRAVLLALGGADAHIELRTGQEQAFADEIIRLVETYGFDGLDIDLEQAAVTAADNQTVIPDALRIVKNHYRAQGKNFLITMAPEFPYLTKTGAYIPYISNLEGYYDWINPQFYNQGGDGIYIDGIGWIAQNNDALKKEFIYYMADSLINGTRGFYKIPHDKLVFGIPTNIDAAATGYVKNPKDLFGAFDKLKSQGQPLRGVMTWSINWDMGRNAAGQAYDESFIQSYGPFIHDQDITPPPVENGKPLFSGLTDTRIKQGTAFDPLAGVTASDREDGDLTNQILVEGSVDTKRIGLYPLTYKVSDRDNNVTEQVRSVEVYNMKPTLSGVTDTTIELGTLFDPLAGVSARDEEDGIIETSKIEVIGSVDSNKVGRYSLTYQVSDSAGQQVSQQRNVTVKVQGDICDNNWDANQVYVEGDMVNHNGKRWRAEWWTQNEEPGTTGEWGVWRSQGDSDCGGTTPPAVDDSSEFTVSGLSSSYPLVNGQVSISINLTTANPVRITATLEQNGHSYGSASTENNGNGSLLLQLDNVASGNYELVLLGQAEGQESVEQRFPVSLTEDGQGGEGDYPTYAPNTGYQAGERVSNAGGNYECKPWPYSGWCGGSPGHYAPGAGSAWSDAWIKL